MIEAREISKSFGGHDIFRGLSFSLESQKRVALIGPTGCGKSVLLRSLLGLEEIQAGSIKADRQSLSACLQSHSLLPWLTVLQNLQATSPLEEASLRRELDAIGLGGFKDHFPLQISGGMQQKINLLRAFLPNPKMLLMDEPFTHLDHAQKLELYELTKHFLREKACGMLLITHDIDEALYLGEEIWLATRSPMRITERIASPFKGQNSIHDLHRHPEYPAVFEKVLSHLQREKE